MSSGGCTVPCRQSQTHTQGKGVNLEFLTELELQRHPADDPSQSLLQVFLSANRVKYRQLAASIDLE